MPYTYYLRNKITNEKYYGVRYAKNCDPSELWATYFSSSKIVAGRIASYGKDSFEFEVRKVFATAQQARNWEERVLRRLDILHRTDWLNQNVCGKFLKDGPKSPKTRKKLASATRADWERRKKVGWHRPAFTKEERATISKRLTGVPKTEEHVAHMKSRWHSRKVVKCPHCEKTGQYANMKRWHFENCKTLGGERKLYKCPHCGARKALPGVMRHHFDRCKKKGKK